jgi:hypothetical protein
MFYVTLSCSIVLVFVMPRSFTTLEVSTQRILNNAKHEAACFCMAALIVRNRNTEKSTNNIRSDGNGV